MAANNIHAGAEIIDGRGMAPFNPALLAETLEPRPTERPAPRPDVRLPRSTARSYSYAEQCVAADLLEKLRRGDDLRQLAHRATAHDAETALDVAVDRLLRVL
jgi:hypothetical protein